VVFCNGNNSENGNANGNMFSKCECFQKPLDLSKNKRRKSKKSNKRRKRQKNSQRVRKRSR
jgi:hypothetical protein